MVILLFPTSRLLLSSGVNRYIKSLGHWDLVFSCCSVRLKSSFPQNTDQKKELQFRSSIETLFSLWKEFIWTEKKSNQHSLFQGRKTLLFSAVALLACSKILNVQVPLIFKKIVDSVAISSVSPTELLISSPFFLLVTWSVVRLSSILSAELRNVLFSKVTQSIIKDIHRIVFDRLSRVKFDDQNPSSTVYIVKVLDRGTRSLQGLTSSFLLNIIPTSIECIMVMGVLTLYFGWKIAAIGGAGVFLYSFLTIRISESRISIRTKMNQAENAVSSSLVEAISNAEAIHTTPNAHQSEAARHDKLLSVLESASLKTASSLAFLNGVQGTLITASITAMMGLGLFTQCVITPGDLVLMQGLLIQLANPLGFLGMAYREGRQSLAEVQTLGQLFNSTEFPQKISDCEKTAIEAIQDAIKAGKKRILLVGSSGGGKSTLARQLALNLNEDCIWVPQDVSQLFSRSVSENLSFGMIGISDTALEDEIIGRALSLTKLPPEIKTRPLKERGSNLSGGERQRILLARAFVRLLAKQKEVKLIVLDEPTSWLDSVTEAHVLESLFELAAETPIIIVTHSIAAMASYSDWIFVVSQEATSKRPIIVEQGPWSQLSSSEGPFSVLWKRKVSNS